MTKNAEVAGVVKEKSLLLQFGSKYSFKFRVYLQGVQSIISLSEDIPSVAERGELTKNE